MYLSSCLPAIRAAVQGGVRMPDPKRPRSRSALSTELQAAVLGYIRSKSQASQVDEKYSAAILDGFLRLYADLTVLAFHLSDDARQVVSSDDSPEMDLLKLVDLYLADVFVCRGHVRSVLAGVELVHHLFPYASISKKPPDMDLIQWCELHKVVPRVRGLLHSVLGDQTPTTSKVDVSGAHSPSQTKDFQPITPGDITSLRLSIADYLGPRGSKIEGFFRDLVDTIYKTVVSQAEIMGCIVLGNKKIDLGRVSIASVPRLIQYHINWMMDNILQLPDLLTYSEQVEIVRSLIVHIDLPEFAKILKEFCAAFDNPAHALVQMVHESPREPLAWLEQNRATQKIYYRNPSTDGTESISGPAAEQDSADGDDTLAPVAVGDAEVAAILRDAERPIASSEASEALGVYFAQMEKSKVLSHVDLVEYIRRYQALLQVQLHEYQATLPANHPHKTLTAQKLTLKLLKTILIPSEQNKKRIREIKHIQDRLCECNLKLVVGIARRYRGSKIPLPDLIQEGSIGLCIAFIRFDPDKGYRFSTYAAWWVRHAVGRAVSWRGVIRTPDWMYLELNKYLRAIAGLRCKHGRVADDNEILLELDWTPEQLAAVREAFPIVVSSDVPRNADDGRAGATYGDFFKSEMPDTDSVLADKQMGVMLRQVLRQMPRMYREVITRRHGIDCREETLEQIGESVGVTRERIRQIGKKAEMLLFSRMKKLVADADDVGIAA